MRFQIIQSQLGWSVLYFYINSIIRSNITQQSEAWYDERVIFSRDLFRRIYDI